MDRASIASLSLVVILVGCVSEGEPTSDANGGESGGGSGGSATGGSSSSGKGSGGSSGGAARGGSSGTAQGGSSGTAQGGSSGSSGGAGAPACHGDAATFDELTQGPIGCETNSDCCVVIDPCITEGRIVRAGDEEAALAAWPYCNDECTDCIPPKVEVGCRDGVCVGTEIDDLDFDSPLRETHCGTDDEAMPDGTGETFGCG